ncbi:MAG: HAD family phosphatase [Deltaproteobacteria bacterium]|nr:HAD family phosphatase [Deltaproteobacteria bacterium]
MFKVDSSIKALIFDCDGTLADTMEVHHQAWKETLAHFGKECPQVELELCSGIPSTDLVKMLNQEFGWKLDPLHFCRKKEGRFRELAVIVRPIEPVVALARAYAGKLPMAVASGGTRENVEFTLEAIGLQGVFDAVITADDDVAPKPSPEIFLEAARRLGVSPQACLVFEDGVPGIQGARQAGMQVIDVTKEDAFTA